MNYKFFSKHYLYYYLYNDNSISLTILHATAVEAPEISSVGASSLMSRPTILWNMQTR